MVGAIPGDIRALLKLPTKMDKYEQLLYSIGNFVLTFAEVEYSVHKTLARLAGLSDELRRALFSGTRADAAISLINRMLEISDDGHASATNKKRFKHAFDQFKVINEARNLLLHHGLERPWGIPTHSSSNARVALTKERLKSMHFTPEVLDNMAEDLGKIQLIISFAAVTKGKELPVVDKLLREPWLYIPPQAQTKKAPKSSEKGNHKRARVPKVQPRSSPE